MRRLAPFFAAIFLAISILPVTASAATRTPRGCLNQSQQKAAIKNGRAITLARTLAVVRKRAPGDIIQARLCRERGTLVYVVTVISRKGKVVRVRVNGATGAYMSKR